MGRHLQLALAILVLACPAGPPARAAAELTEDDRDFLTEADALLTAEEKAAFADLGRTYLRVEFIDRFWASRDPFPETGRNELAEVWERRRELAVARFGSLAGSRPQTMLLLGPPDEILTGICTGELRDLEIWRYGRSSDPDRLGLPGRTLADAGLPADFTLVFVASRDSSSGFERWPPDREIASLVEPQDDAEARDRAVRCLRESQAVDLLTRAVDWQTLVANGRLVPVADPAWLEELDPFGRAVVSPPSLGELPVTLELGYPGRRKRRTVLQGVLTVPRDELPRPTATEPLAGLEVRGRVVRGDRLADSFRYRFYPGSALDEPGTPTMIFQRPLPAGDYELLLAVEDPGSGRGRVFERRLTVPGSAAPASGEAPGQDLLEASAPLTSEDHVVRIVPPPPQVLHTGRLRVEARVLGEGVERVAFVLDGRPLMAKTRPPYSVELDLGPAPRIHELVVLASGPHGRELARDRLRINGGAHRFTVRLVEPLPTHRYRKSLRARAEIGLPTGERLDRLDLYLNEKRQATLFQPPWVQPLLLTGGESITYVRAVGYLGDGNSAEDLVFVNLEGGMDRVRVHFVELYTTVLDRSGRPVEGLVREDFTVFEMGEEQDIVRFERVRDLPIHAGILLDTSTSMTEELDEAVRAGLAFFESVLSPRDRAAVVVFNDAPELQVPFTNRVPLLANGLENLEAGGDTALYDSLAFTLHYFAGIRGKRAIVLISDGSDSGSRFSFDDVLDYARRAGVAVYAIGLGVPSRALLARAVLRRLADETGGRYFTVTGARELGPVYRSIEEELRSQYLLGYQSATIGGDGFREVRVEVAGKGLEATTIPGYHP